MAFATEQIQAGGNDLTVIYPMTRTEALVGAVAPPLENAFTHKVRVVKTSHDKRYRVVLMERNEDMKSYSDREFYRCWTKAGAIRKGNRLVQRGINMGGVQ